MADYIPQLRRVDPEKFGIAVCTVDGQRFSAGDTNDLFCVQSMCKPINYSLALEEHGTRPSTVTSAASPAAVDSTNCRLPLTGCRTTR